MFEKLFVFCVCSIFVSSLFCQTIDRSSIGVIKNVNGQRCGTGFVVGLPNYVVSCFHVLNRKNPQMYFESAEDTVKSYKLNVFLFDTAKDIVLFIPEKQITKNPLIIDLVELPLLKDTIIYLGFDVATSTKLNINFRYDISFVEAINYQFKSDGYNTKSFEFKGFAVKGYSGGPVLNKTGKVIGILAQEFKIPSIQDFKFDSVHYNRAFTVFPIFDWISK